MTKSSQPPERPEAEHADEPELRKEKLRDLDLDEEKDQQDRADAVRGGKIGCHATVP